MAEMSQKDAQVSQEDHLCHSSANEVTHVKYNISYDDFFSNFMLPNRPCVFPPLTTINWKSRSDWLTADGQPDLDFLEEHFGQASVPVADCSTEQHRSHCKQEMLLCEYLQYWRDYQQKGYPLDMDCLYLKDWHFLKMFPDYEAYNTPVYFQSDWLNEFWLEGTDSGDDYRFVYMGPKGTWTPFHADVFRSYSWSANICGRKKWVLVPPGQEKLLNDSHGNLPFDLSSMLHDEKVPPGVHIIEVIQEAGEVIFVPSGWFHQVWNLEDTISINHNWLNGCNIDIAWHFLEQSLQDVQREIADCQGMEGWTQQCQLILKSCNGIDYAEFYQFISHIAENRIKVLKESDSHCMDNFNSGTSHLPGLAIYPPKPGCCGCKGDNKDPGGVHHDFREILSYCEKGHDRKVSHWVFDLERVISVLNMMKESADFVVLNLSADELSESARTVLHQFDNR